MPADRLLNTVLQYYADVHDEAKTNQIFGTTAHLLSQLANPLNLGVLTSQLLTAPAIWQRHDGLRTAIRIISIYNTAAIRVREDEIEREKEKLSSKPNFQPPRESGGLDCETWVRAVVKGADDYSRRWQHLLVLAGVLMGMEGNDRHSLSGGLRATLENAVVTAANLALQRHQEDGPFAGSSIALALNYAFPLLSPFRQAQIDCDALLPIIVWNIVGDEGFRDGQFIHAINQDITEAPGKVLSWNAQSPSFQLLREMEQRPLMGNMGPLAKLAAYAVQHATHSPAVLEAHDTLFLFTRKILDAWQSNRLSDIDPAYEGHRLTPETIQTTWAPLWETLRKMMFATVVVLQAVVSRSLIDPQMSVGISGPAIATKSLHILRNLYFISSRQSSGSFQAYVFTNLTSIDVLSRDPMACELLLRELRPVEDTPVLATTHFARILDLFYLNLAEHLPLSLSTEACDALVIQPATGYLSHEGEMTPFLVQLFEASHSAILSVLSCPQHSPLTISVTPFYSVKLLESFPHRMSPRQFRMAFKTVMQIVSPPFPIAALQPDMSEALLEMLLDTISNAAVDTLPPPPDASPLDDAAESSPEPFSEQSALTMALVDSLPFLPLPLVEEWLTVTAQALNRIADPRLRAPVKQRFWDILVNGEMDVERALIGVSWWGTLGGRELVLHGGSGPNPAMMSGALNGDVVSSKL